MSLNTHTYFSLNHCTLLSIKKKEYWFAIEDKSILMKDVRLHIQVENIINILSLLGEGHTFLKTGFYELIKREICGILTCQYSY